MNMTFGVGNVMGTGFRVWFRNLIPFLLITAIFYALPWLWAASALNAEPTPENLRHASIVFGVVSLLSVFLNAFVTAVLSYGVVMELHGQRASIGACLATGLSRFLPALGVGILAGLATAGAFLLLIVPGFIVLCMLYVATTVSVIERPGAMASLRRSRELTRGHKMEIFGIVVLIFVLELVVSLVLGGVVTSPGATTEAAFVTMRHQLYLTVGQQVVFGSLNAVMASVAYVFLRFEKEGTSAAELAAIFD